MSDDNWPSDQEVQSLSRMVRETSDFYEGLATALRALGSQAPSIYRFDIAGRSKQSLGIVILPSDSDAVALGMDIIGNTTRRGEGFSGCVLKISDEERTVVTIPL